MLVTSLRGTATTPTNTALKTPRPNYTLVKSSTNSNQPRAIHLFHPIDGYHLSLLPFPCLNYTYSCLHSCIIYLVLPPTKRETDSHTYPHLQVQGLQKSISYNLVKCSQDYKHLVLRKQNVESQTLFIIYPWRRRQMRSALSLSIAIRNECTADINVLENFIEFPKQFIETNVSPRWNLDRKIMSKRSWLDICTRVEDTSSNSATYTEFIEERVNVLKESSSDKFARFQWLQ